LNAGKTSCDGAGQLACVRRCRGNNAKAQETVRTALPGADVLHKTGTLGQDAARPHKRPVSIRRKTFKTLAPVDQRDCQRGLQPPDPGRQGWLRQATRISCPGKMPVLGQGDQQSQVNQIIGRQAFHLSSLLSPIASSRSLPFRKSAPAPSCALPMPHRRAWRPARNGRSTPVSCPWNIRVRRSAVSRCRQP